MRIGVDLDEVEFVGLLAGERVHLLDLFDLVAEQMDAPGAVFVVRRENVDGVAAHAERAAEEIGLRALVLQRHQIGHQLALVELAALLEREGHGRIGFDRADTVDARHRGDDDDVVAFEQRARRAVAHAVDLLVDRGFLLDIGVGARDVGFRLVVVVIGDEIFDRVVGEERLELAVELRRQRLVRREDERRALRRLDHLGHGEGLAGAGDAKQHLRAVVALDAFDQVRDRLRLVALRLEVGFDDEALAAFGFFRARRAVRRPRLRAEFRPALAQQIFQRLRGGGDAHRRQPAGPAAAGRPSAAGISDRFAPRDALGAVGGWGVGIRRVPHARSARDLPSGEGLSRRHLQAQLLRQRRIEPGDRRAGRSRAAAPPRNPLARCRLARLVRGGEIGAAVERIVRRRLQARCPNPGRRCPWRSPD